MCIECRVADEANSSFQPRLELRSSILQRGYERTKNFRDVCHVVRRLFTFLTIVGAVRDETRRRNE